MNPHNDPKIRLIYVKGAKNEASDILNAIIKKRCPIAPNNPKKDRVIISFCSIGSQFGKTIKVANTDPIKVV